jgi:hypothetical protein
MIKLAFMPLIRRAMYVSAATVIASAPLHAQHSVSLSGQTTPLQAEHLAYDLKIGGLHVADFLAEFSEDSDGYRTTLTMEIRGMARWFQDFRAELVGEGKMVIETGRGLTPVPRVFDRAWEAQTMAATLTIGYDPITGLAQSQERMFNPQTGETLTYEDMEWNQDRELPPPVPDDLRTGVFDPMAAFVAARAQIHHGGRSEFRVPIYDGRRRYDLVGEVEAPRAFWMGGKDVELIPVLARVEPVFGFDKRRTETIEESTGRLLFSPDERFIPVQVMLRGRMFSSVMNLTADCAEDAATCQQIASAPDTAP